MNCFVVISYAIAAEIGHMLFIPPGKVTPLWPPSGIALAFTLLLGNRIWPGILLGAFIGISFPAISAAIIFAVILISIVVVIEIILGAYLHKNKYSFVKERLPELAIVFGAIKKSSTLFLKILMNRPVLIQQME